MDRTPFAGLTVIEPGESIYIDGGSFLDRNIRSIDKLLELGAATHIHDEHPALPNPTVKPTLAAVASGGAIPAATTLWAGYSLIDAQGGESLISPLASAVTPAGLNPPASAPSAAADYSGGELRADVFRYCVTITDGRGGETAPSPYVEVFREPGYASGKIVLSGLQGMATAVGGAAWRLYRAAGGGAWGFLTGGSTPGFTDDGLTCIDCGVIPPEAFDNTTNQTNQVKATLSGVPAGTSFIRLYANTDAELLSPSLVGQYPVASAGAVVPITTLAFSGGSPVPVATTHGGARQINPDTELYDFHWLRPVTASAALPSAAASGDVRLTLDTMRVWGFKNGQWQRVGQTRAIGSAATATLAAAASGNVAIPLAASFSLVRLATNVPARVRLYTTAAKRTADVARPIGSDPTGDHGLIAELVTIASDLDWDLTPAAVGANLETTPTDNIPSNVTNLGSGSVAVAVTATYLPLE